jgi:hypothetical protein
MWNDRDEATVRAADGAEIPQLTLSRAVDEDLEELTEALDPDDEAGAEEWRTVDGKFCGQTYRAGDLDPAWVGRLLDAAGDHRLLSRAAAVSALFEGRGREQVFYERLAEALGYKNNRLPFLQLAGLLPAEDLRAAVPREVEEEEKALALEAALFTAAGFLEQQGSQEDDPETIAYRRALHDAWRAYCSGLGGAQLGAEHWKLGGARPVNYPTRRMAALARLLARHLHSGVFGHVVHVANTARPEGRQRPDTALRASLLALFQELEHPYWSFRYTLGGRRLARARALIGEERATGILVDVLLPVLLGHAETEGDAELRGKLCELWWGLPPRQDNAVTRRMCQTIFSGKADARKVVNSARRQQGLHQLYRDCCCSDAGCHRCIVYLARQAGKTLMPA